MIDLMIIMKRIKVSNGLTAIGGQRPTVSWAQDVKGGAYPSSYAASFFPDCKQMLS